MLTIRNMCDRIVTELECEVHLVKLLSQERSFILSYDKPFTNIIDRINILKGRQLNIPDDNEAEEYIHLVSHHTLINGYKDLYEISKDVFDPSVTIKVLFTTHIIYTSFNSILLKNILHIEKSLKSNLSFIIGKDFGVETDTSPLLMSPSGKTIPPKPSINPLDYLSLKNYSGANKYNILQKIIYQVKDPFEKSLSKYYLDNKNHTPPWIIANDLSLGKISNWYEILQPSQKDYVSNQFFNNSFLVTNIERKEILTKALSQMKEFRDIVAHGNKTTKIKFKYELPKLAILNLTNTSSILCESEYLSNIGKNDIFGLIISMLVLLNNQTLVSLFTFEIFSLLEIYKPVSYSGLTIYDVLCIPNDFEERITRFIKIHYNLTY